MVGKKKASGHINAFDTLAAPGESAECEIIILLSKLTQKYEVFPLAPNTGVKCPSEVTGHDFSTPMDREMREETYKFAYNTACTFVASILVRFEAGKMRFLARY